MGKGIESWTDRDYAQAAIDMLPGTVEEIAEFLKAQGVKGERYSASRCPIACWVQRWTGNREWVTGVATRRNVDGEILVWNPKPILNFVEAFDRGQIIL